MAKKYLIINTHPEPNPGFINPLRNLLKEKHLSVDVLPGYSGDRPSEAAYRAVFLTGVPLEVDYSLSQQKTVEQVQKHSSWLRSWKHPLLGICYGHQILGTVFGGSVASLPSAVIEDRLNLSISPPVKKGIFANLQELTVFAEHRDYLSRVPKNFLVLSKQKGIPYLLYDPGREFYGMQFVPERSGPTADQVLSRFLRL